MKKNTPKNEFPPLMSLALYVVMAAPVAIAIIQTAV